MDKQFGRNLFILTNKLRRLLDKRYSKNGLYIGQARMLVYLYHHKDQKTYQKDIEEAFQIRSGTVTGVIDNLITQDLLLRIESETDKRKRKILLTPKGEDAALQCIETIADVESSLSNILSEEERVVFDNLLIKINKWVDEEELK